MTSSWSGSRSCEVLSCDTDADFSTYFHHKLYVIMNKLLTFLQGHHVHQVLLRTCSLQADFAELVLCFASPGFDDHKWTETRSMDISCDCKYTKREMSYWRNFDPWLHLKLSFWQLPVQPVINISSAWHFVSMWHVTKLKEIDGHYRICLYIIVSKF